MAGAKTLRRLKRFRQLEADESLSLLELAIQDRDSVQRELDIVMGRWTGARGDFRQMVLGDDRIGRIETSMEIESLGIRVECMRFRLARAQLELEAQREQYLAHRQRHRQMETLLGKRLAEDERMASRRAQEIMDDWYGRARRTLVGRDSIPAGNAVVAGK